jgi:tRNA pseudouridine55 synthase
LTGDTSFVLPIDKPAGPTSHDVVARARRALGVKRIGHTGTLDPFASGLMLLCVGWATRIAEYLSDLPKTYHATARLDGRTLTDDNTSEVLEPSERWRALTREQIEAALQAQTGDIMQLPPQYSAKKIAGERAYDIARRGDVATIAPVPVHIDRIALTALRLPEIEFEVECGSGTYIRAIARDAGAQLGTGGYLTALRRTRVGSQDARDALAAEEMDNMDAVRRAAITPLRALAHLPTLTLTEAEERAIRFGQAIERDTPMRGTVKLVRADVLVGIGEVDGPRIRPHKVLPNV